MRAAWKIVVGGVLIAAVALDALGVWAARVPVSTNEASPAGRGVVAAIPQAGGTQVTLPVQGPGLDSMAGKRQRRSG